MGVAWNDTLRTGIEDIDDQHKEIFTRINSLFEACYTNQEENAVKKYLSFLREYVAYHFAAEEREMITHQYPEFAQHEAEHDQLKQRVNQLYERVTTGGVTNQIVVAAISSSAAWLVDHILMTDKAMAEFLLKHKA